MRYQLIPMKYNSNPQAYYTAKSVVYFTLFLCIALSILGVAMHDLVNKTAVQSQERHNLYISKELHNVDYLQKNISDTDDTFHLFSHGRPGMLLIDGEWVGAQQIAKCLAANESIKGKTTLNIYGCYFAQGKKGTQAVSYLEKELGIAVAASTNATGKDGDWVLETQNKDFSTRLGAYPYTLQCTGPAGDCDGDGEPDTTDLDDDNDGILDTVEANINTYYVSQATPGGGVTNANNILGDTPTTFAVVNSYSSVTIEFPADIPSGTNLTLRIQRNGSIAPVDFDIRPLDSSGAVIGPTRSVTVDNGAINLGYVNFPVTTRYFRVTGGGNVGSRHRLYSVSSTVEIGDVDGDGIINSQDLDSDGDGCYDVVESGGIDADNNGVLDGTGIDANGHVTGGVGGYDGLTPSRDEYTALLAPDSGTNGSLTICATESFTEPELFALLGGTPDTGGVWTDSGGTAVVFPVSTPDVYSYTTSAVSTVCTVNSTSTVSLILDSVNDTDSDGIGSECDLDDDNDGILDTDEGQDFIAQVTRRIGYLTDLNPILGNDLGTGMILGQVILGRTPPTTSTRLFVRHTLGDYEAGDVITIRASLPAFVPGNSGSHQGGLTINMASDNFNSIPGTEQYHVFTPGDAPRDIVYVVPVDAPRLNIEGEAGIHVFRAQRNRDTDKDGIVDALDLDSDRDGCFDVLEAAENITASQLLPSGAIDIANQGGIDTAGVPNAVSAGGQGQANTTAAIITDTIDHLNGSTGLPVVCEGSDITLSVTTYAAQRIADHGAVAGLTDDTFFPIPEGDKFYQWYLGATPLTNGALYSGVTSANLQINNTPLSLDGSTYRVEVTTLYNSCPLERNYDLSVTALPTPDAGADTAICEDDTFTATATATNGTIAWTTSGDGTFADATIEDAVYTPGAGDITAGTVTLTMTVTNAGCVGSDTVVLTIDSLPTADAGAATAAICDSETYTATATATNGTIAWTTSGDGTFADATIEDAVYTPGTNDITVGTVTLTMTVTGTNAGCGTTVVSDTSVITINPAPTADAGAATAAICEDETYTATATATNGTIAWTTSGDGTFADATIEDAVYTPGTNDITVGTVTLTMTVTNAGCSVSDTVVLTIDSLPTADAGADTAICEGDTFTATATATNGTIAWTTSGDGTFADATIEDAVYTPGTTDSTNGTVTLTMTVTGTNPSCGTTVVSDTIVFTIAATPNAGINGTTTVCSTETLTEAQLFALLGGAPEAGGTWTDSGGNPVSFPVSAADVYTYTVGRLWTPADITTDVWLDAADTATITESGGFVSQWNDKSGNNNHFTQPISSRQGITNSVNLNGNNVIDFDGAKGMINPTNIIDRDNDYFVAVIYAASRTSLGASRTLVGRGSSTGTYNWLIGPYNGQNNVYVGSFITGSPAALNNYFINTINTDASASNSFYENGNLIGVRTGNRRLGALSIGVEGSYGEPANSHIAEIIVIPNEISTPERQRIEGYMAHKWGLEANLPASHPYRAAAPFIGACAPTSATVTVTVDPAPTADAGADTAICEGDTFTATATATNGTIAWTTSGDGTFADATIEDAVYTPGTTDSTNGTVTLTMTVTGTATCSTTVVSDTIVFTIAAAPDAGTNGTTTMCSTETLTEAQLFALLGGTPEAGGTWTDSGGNPVSFPVSSADVYTYTVATATRPWTPADITTNLWLDAADLSTITESGGAVSQWNDKSGNNNHFTQPISSRQGITNSVNLNGNNVIDFDGAKGMINPTNIIDRDNDYFVAVIYAASRTSLGASRTLVGRGSSTATYNWLIGPYSGQNRVYVGSFIAGSPAALNNYFINTINTDASASNSFYENGNLIGVRTGNTRLGALSIGVEGTVSQPANSHIAEIIVIPNEISTPERQRIEGYMAHKWGLEANLPASHPYSAAAPVVSACPPAVATVTVTVDPAPTADAGAATAAICEGDTFTATATATNGTIAWTTSGDGTFADATIEDAVYTPGATDTTNGTVTLTMTVTGTAACSTIVVSDTSVITIEASPDAGTNGATNICSTDTLTEAQLFALLGGTPEAGGTWTDSGGNPVSFPVSAADVYTYTVASTAARPWTPADITTSLWLDAADASTITESGGAVSQWNDKSGNNNHAANSTPARQPTYIVSDPIAGNMPSIGSLSNNGSIGLLTPPISADIAFLISYYNSGTETTFNNYNTLFSGSGANGAYRVMGNSGTDDFIGTSNFNNAGTYKNGATTSSSNTVLPMPLTLWKFESSTNRTQSTAIGYNQLTASRGWIGAYSEVIFANGLTNTEKELIEGYLAWKWGLEANLPASHPYSTAAPMVSACPPAVATVTVTVDAAPTADAGAATAAICEGDTFTATATATNGTIAWTTSGDGTFADATIEDAVYTPGTTDSTNGTVTLTMTVTGTCSATVVSDTIILTLSAAPTADAGADTAICEGDVFTATATATNGTIAWTTSGDGTFADNTIEDAVYTPGATDSTNGTVTLTMSVTGTNAGCGTTVVSDTSVITIDHVPTADAGAAGAAICAGNDFTAAATATDGTIAWTTSGDGTFADATIEDAVYTPGATDSTNGTVTLTMTVTGMGGCSTTVVSDTIILTIGAPPAADAGADTAICEGDVFTAAATATGGTIAWTTSGDGTFADATVEDAVYTPGTTDSTNGTVTLTMTVTNTSCSISDIIMITIEAAPNAGTNGTTTICGTDTLTEAQLFALLGGTPDAGGTWTDSGGNPVSFPVSSADVYTYTVEPTPSIPWTPAQISANLWLDATDASTITEVGGNVNQWNDKSGNSNNFTGTDMPITNARTLNGLNVIDFNGTSNYLDGGDILDVGTGDYTVISVLDIDDVTSNYGAVWSKSRYSGDPGRIAAYITSPNTLRFFEQFTAGTNLDVPISTGSLVLSNELIRGSRITTYSNGSSSGSTPSTNTGNIDTPYHFLIGGYANSSGGVPPQVGFYLDGAVGEFVVGAFTPTERQLVEGYLAHKWGLVANLPASHPYRAAAPLAGVCPPAVATVTVTVDPAPTADAGADTAICEGDTFTATATATNGTIAWTTSGDGTFADATIEDAVYTPGATDSTNGTVTLTMTVTGTNAGCSTTVVSDTSVVTIAAAPDAGTNGTTTICSTDTLTEAQLFALLGGTPEAGGAWTDSGGNPVSFPVSSADVYTYTVAPPATRPWTPADLTTDVWLDAADTATITESGGFVSQWNDKSGNNNHLTQTVGANQPTITGTMLTFNVNDNMDFTNTFPSAGWWAITVGAPRATTDWRTLLRSSTSGNHQVLIENGSIDLGSYSSGFFQAGSLQWGVGEQAVVGINAMGSNIAFSKDGGSFIATGGNIRRDVMFFGGNGAANTQGFGDVFEFVAFDAAPTLMEQQMLEGYLAHKWGLEANLPASHPYRAVAPMVSACPPAVATVTVTVDPAPTADAGADTAICEGDTFTATATATNGTIAWTTSGDGTFADATVEDAVYTPGATDSTNGTVTLTMTVTGTNPSCGTTVVSDTIVFTIATTPNAGVNGTTTMCSTDTLTEAQLFALLGGTPGVGGSWTDSGGNPVSFPVSSADVYTYTVASTATRPWTPADITTNLWLDAADASTITESGGAVSQWNDKSGNTRHATQGIAVNQPTTGGTINGVTALNFGDNTNVQYLNINQFGTGTYTWFFIVDNSDNTTNNASILGAANGRTYLPIGATGPTNTNYARVNNVNNPAGLQLLVDGETTQSISTRQDAYDALDKPVLFVIEDSPIMNANLLVGSAFRTGGASAYRMNGQIGEAIVMSSPSLEDRQRIEGYLAHKWGLVANLPASHPYRGAAPLAIACPPAVATVTVTVDPAPTADAGAAGADVCEGDDFTAVATATGGTIAWTTSGDGTFADNTLEDAVYTPGAADIAAGTVTLTMTVNGASAGLWTPAELTTDIWFDANDASTITEAGGQVSQWNDKSGNAHNLVQATGASQPITGVAAIGGVNAISFDGVNDVLSNTAFNTSTANYSIFTVRRVNTIAAGDRVFAIRSGTGLLNEVIVASGSLVGHRSPQNEHVFFTSGTNSLSYSYIKGGTNSQSLYLNGNTPPDTNAAGLTTFTTTEFHLGASSATAQFADIDVGEMVVIASALNDADRERMEGYLAHKWGLVADLPAFHPYKTTPPASLITICPPAVDTIVLTIGAAPTADAGAAGADVCEGDDYTAAATATGGTIAWTTSGDGTFADATIEDAVYTPGATDSTNGTVTLTMTVTGTNAGCGATVVSDTIILTIGAAPTADAGAAGAAICDGDDFIAAATATGGTIAWTSSGDGSFADNTIEDVVYTPGATDSTNGTVTLTMTVTGTNIGCGATVVSDTIILSIGAAPTADAGTAGADVCEGDDYTAAATATGGTIAWTTSGDGTFADNTIEDVVYTPGAGDITAGTVTLTMTVTGTNAGCGATRSIRYDYTNHRCCAYSRCRCCGCRCV